MKCESCNINEIEVEESEDAEQKPYLLCKPCQQSLLNYSLRPLHFFNLASIHGHSYYLHDDFYDYDTGEATQPKSAVLDADIFAFPKLDAVKNDLKKLVDYGCVQYSTSEKVIELLKLHDKEAILNYLDYKVKYNRAINYKAYEIAGAVLALYACEWMRREWKNRKENEILIFGEPIYQCLPITEAFQILTTEIELSGGKYFTHNSSALLYFQSSKTLDWIERISNRITNVSTSWGMLAAASQFSWTRAEMWLTMGRPLSLIALDALVFCTTNGEKQHHPFWFRKHPPVLADSAKSSTIAKGVTDYLEKDSVPRTKNAVKQIIQNLFETSSG